MSSRQSSDIWYHFNKTEANRAVCKYCSSLLSIAGGSLGNLRRHLKNKHPTVPMERRGTIPSEGSSQTPSTSGESIALPPPSRSRSPLVSVSALSSNFSISIPPSASAVSERPEYHRPSITQSSLTQFVHVIKPLPIQKSKVIDVQLLRMICKEYHPFSLVDDPEFKKFVSLLCPNYKLPSRKTLSQSLLPQLYSDLVLEVRSKLDASTAVALTTDGWTSVNNQSFVAITAHYINSGSILCSNLLGCAEFSERHTSINLATMLRSQCGEWGISSKLTAIVTDNASNIVAAANQITKHIPCYAHTLNLIVKSGITPINYIIEKCKIIVQHFKKSSHALNKLHETQRQMSLPELKLIQDVPTRWNSTYEMLRRLLANKDPVLATLALLQFEEVAVSNYEWKIIEHAINILDIFDEVTKELSAEKCVTISKAMILSRNLVDYMKEQTNIPDLLAEMKEVCEKLLKEIGDRLILKEHDFLPEASLLDPRFKKPAFKNVKKFDTVHAALVAKIQSQVTMEMDQSPSSAQPQIASLPSSSKIWAKFDKETDASTATNQSPKATAIVEMDKYLSESLLPRLSDPLQWWDQRKLIYPHLYKLAMARLCIPGSAVPCERIFSKAGQVMTEKRNRLVTNKLSKLLFVQFNA